MMPRNYAMGRNGHAQNVVYGAEGKKEGIRYTLSPCSLGLMLVATSHKGVCAITLGDDADALLEDLSVRFPEAEIRREEKDPGKTAAAVLTYLENPRTGWTLPLDIRGTAFQQRVWKALREIPAGKTASYAQIAKKIGRPKAVRAVAQACGANSISVAIPCHRVVRTDGSLSGYHWGVERKAALIKREKTLQETADRTK